jgi:hypothetical protein
METVSRDNQAMYSRKLGRSDAVLVVLSATFLRDLFRDVRQMQLQRVLHNPLLHPPKKRVCGFALATESVPDFDKRPHKFPHKI